MLKLGAMVDAHKKQVQRLIHSSDISLSIILPTAKVSVGVNPLYGQLARETDESGTSYGPISCLWYDALALNMNQPTGAEYLTHAMAGQYSTATGFAEVWLEDVLDDVTNVYGKTYFDLAKTVIMGNHNFQVLGYIRTGLPTSSPYICVVALRGEENYES